jgi:GNAT superfamily N-acetyltransferase
MMKPVSYRTASSDEDLHQILALQQRNLEEGLSPREVRDQGFVTVRHDFALLRSMNDAAPHIIAVSDGQVVGYALVMLRSFRDRIPILQPMFATLGRLTYRERPVNGYHYCIMGQVCIDKPWRGQGVFGGLYQALRRHYSEEYDLVITEVAQRNGRSIRAHEKVGFELLHRYPAADGEVWDLILWDWQK